MDQYNNNSEAKVAPPSLHSILNTFNNKNTSGIKQQKLLIPKETEIKNTPKDNEE